MKAVVVAAIVFLGGCLSAVSVDPDPACEILFKAVEKINAIASEGCNDTCYNDQGNMAAAQALGAAGPTGCDSSYNAGGQARVAALAAFLLNTPFQSNSLLRAAMVASLGKISKADGFKTMLALAKESEDVYATDTTSTPIWGVIGEVGQDTELQDLAAQALIRAEDRGGYGGQRQNAVDGLVTLAKWSTNFDQWRPTVACLKRAACDRYPDVKFVASSGLQDLGQFTPKVDQSGNCGPCGEKAAAGTACFAQVTWAMSSGIKEHPAWYPGLNASSPFADFQQYLYYLPKCGNPANPPCYGGADPCPTDCLSSSTNVPAFTI